MATTMSAHTIAKIGHASVKPPIDPETNLSLTERDRIEKRKRLQDADAHATDALMAVGGDKLKASQILDMKLQATNDMIAELAKNSKKLSDEEFYERLTSLKAEHRKTLDMCENLYKMKTANTQPLEARSFTSDYKFRMAETIRGSAMNENLSDMHFQVEGESPHAFPLTQSVDYLRNAYRQRDEWDESYRMASSLPIESRGPTSKPPTGAKHRPRTAGQPAVRRSAPKVVWKETRASVLRRRCHSADNLIEELKREEARGDFEQISPRTPTTELVPSQQAIARVSELWDETEIEDLEDANLPSPPGKLKRVRSLDRSIADFNRRKAYERDRQNAETADADFAKGWRHRITIPEPFNFTIRDEQLPKSKTRSMELFQDETTRRQQEEIEECNKKFKANPVPAHIFMPMYESLMERQESRRHFVREYRQEILKSSQQPFKFDQREEEKRRQKEMQGKVKDGYPLRSRTGERSKSVPRAKSVPSHIYEDRSERMREDQLLRQIKAKMRSDEMLRKAALPGSMEEREKAMKEKNRRKMEANNANAQKFRPRTRKVPNFERLHAKHLKETSSKQGELRFTRPKPFKLKTDERVSREPRRVSQKENEDANAAIRTRRYEDWNNSILQSMEIPPAQNTNSAIIRSNYTKNALQTMRQRDLEEEEQWKRQQRRQVELARSMRDSVGLVNARKSVEDFTDRRTNDLRQQDMQRQREYRQEIRDMERRLKERPFLVERQAQLGAKKQAEMNYSKILKESGVDERFVEDYGSSYRPEDADGYDRFDDNLKRSDYDFSENTNFPGRVDQTATMSLERDKYDTRNYSQENTSLSVGDRPDYDIDEEIAEDIPEAEDEDDGRFGEKC